MLGPFKKLRSDFISWQKAILLGVSVYGLAVSSYYFFGEAFLTSQITQPIEYRLRDILGRSPILSERIKIFIFDDPTARVLKRGELYMEEWVEIIQTVAKKNPKAVFIDKTFSYPLLRSTPEAFVKAMQKIDMPVVAGAYVSPTLRSQKTLRDFRIDDYKIANLLTDPQTGKTALVSEIDGIPIKPGLIYGPDEGIEAAFPAIGHLLFDNSAFFKPVIRTARDTAIRHWGLYAADSLFFKGENLLADGHEIYLNGAGAALYNLFPKDRFYDSANSLEGLMRDAAEGRAPEPIKDGDVVILLANMFTGNTEWLRTPLGSMPSGAVVTSVINSTLTGNWLRPINNHWLHALMAAALAALFAVMFDVKGVSFALFGGSALYIATGLGLFCYFDTVYPWLLCNTVYFLTGLTIFAEKMRAFDERARVLKLTFGKTLPDKRLNDIIVNPDSLILEPCGKVVSVMFVDIVGFATISEMQTPKNAFANLKRLLNHLKVIIHEHGGVVDKTLGDGIMAFFGYQYDGGQSYREHADKALECAIKIQRTNLEFSLQAIEAGEPPYPVRIGINSSAVYIGNLGDLKNIDVTLIGNGVNYAQRLESACESFKIMIGATTKDLLALSNYEQVSLLKRSIPVKHQVEPLEAYECNPLVGQEEALQKVIAAQRKFMKIQRNDVRWPLPEACNIKISSSLGGGRVLNFSRGGIAVQLDRYLGRGIIVMIELEADNPELDERLKKERLNQLICECRWGVAMTNGFMHGMQIRSLAPNQQAKFMEILRSTLKNSGKLIDVA